MDQVWQVLDGQVEAGRFPGYVAALRVRGRTRVRAGGRKAINGESMREDTLFRIASISKPIGGALTLALIRDGVLDLDDPVSRWLPELAAPRVLTEPDAHLNQTVPAARPITVRHLLTNTAGWGAVMSPTPLQRAMMARKVYPGPLPPPLTADEFVARVAELPLAFQPGAGFLYDTGIEVLGVLLTRATGKPLSDLLAERITGPLGMASTAFWTDTPRRLATAYQPGRNGLEVLDPPDGLFADPPSVELLGAGLVSTADDLLRFFTAMADGGAPVLSAADVALMTTDALTDEQRRSGEPIVGAHIGWGLGTGVEPSGRWGWSGGTGTTAFVDPTLDTVAVLLTQRGMAGPNDGFDDFVAAVTET